MFLLFSQIVDVSIADIVVDDELCCPSSIENFTKNSSYGYVVCNFFNGCNSGKHPFGYIQSGKVRSLYTNYTHAHTVFVYFIFPSFIDKLTM